MKNGRYRFIEKSRMRLESLLVSGQETFGTTVIVPLAKCGLLIADPADFQTNLTRVRGSLALGRSYQDTHIDANSLVRDNREWLRVRVDAFCGAFFCWAFLHAENVSAGWQR